MLTAQSFGEMTRSIAEALLKNRKYRLSLIYIQTVSQLITARILPIALISLQVVRIYCDRIEVIKIARNSAAFLQFCQLFPHLLPEGDSEGRLSVSCETLHEE